VGLLPSCVAVAQRILEPTALLSFWPSKTDRLKYNSREEQRGEIWDLNATTNA